MAYAYAIEKNMISGDSFGLNRPTLSRPTHGARLLLFVRSPEDLLFVGQSVVAEAPEPGQAKEGSKYTLGAVESFAEHRSLAELAGSLQRTRHFLEPRQDFKGWLVALSKQDFETVVANRLAIGLSTLNPLFRLACFPEADESASVMTSLQRR